VFPAGHDGRLDALWAMSWDASSFRSLIAGYTPSASLMICCTCAGRNVESPYKYERTMNWLDSSKVKSGVYLPHAECQMEFVLR
jgi:hypothetical protein